MLNLLLLLQVVAPAGAAAACMPVHGGPADGMCMGETQSREGDFSIVVLKPAQGARPALPAEVASVLAELLASQRAQVPIPSSLLAPGATASFCARFSAECAKKTPLGRVPLDRSYAANPPWLLQDGRVRIEWMRGRKLEFLSFVTLAGTRVTDIDILPAAVPVKMASPGR